MAKKTLGPVDAKVYNALTGRATLRGIYLTETRFDMTPQALELDDGGVNHTIRPSDIEVTVEEDGVISGIIRFEAISRRKRRRVIYVSARYFVSYHVEGGCDQVMAELFLDRLQASRDAQRTKAADEAYARAIALASREQTNF